MSESEGAAGLWEYVVQLGLEKYETGETQPRYSTVVIVGASRSVISHYNSYVPLPCVVLS